MLTFTVLTPAMAVFGSRQVTWGGAWSAGEARCRRRGEKAEQQATIGGEGQKKTDEWGAGGQQGVCGGKLGNRGAAGDGGGGICHTCDADADVTAHVEVPTVTVTAPATSAAEVKLPVMVSCTEDEPEKMMLVGETEVMDGVCTGWQKNRREEVEGGRRWMEEQEEKEGGIR